MTTPETDRDIRVLAGRYSDAMITRDPVAAAACYSDDGVLHAFDEQPIHGRSAIEKNFEHVLSLYAFIFQMTHQGFVEVDPADPGRALARWHLSEIACKPDSTAGTSFFGTYNDVVVLTDEGWRFAHRRLTGVYVGRIELPGKQFATTMPAWSSLLAEAFAEGGSQ